MDEKINDPATFQKLMSIEGRVEYLNQTELHHRLKSSMGLELSC
jgi:hypothetical protein